MAKANIHQSFHVLWCCPDHTADCNFPVQSLGGSKLVEILNKEHFP